MFLFIYCFSFPSIFENYSVRRAAKPRDMPGPPVSGAEPGFPGDPVSPAYPRLGPAAGSWRETRQTRRSPVLRNQVKNEKKNKKRAPRNWLWMALRPGSSKVTAANVVGINKRELFFTFFCNCRPLHRQIPVRVEVNSKTGRNRVKPWKTGEGTSQ